MADQRILWALGLGGAAALLWRFRQGSLDDISQQVAAAQGMRPAAARHYLRQEAKRLRHQTVPQARQDARDLDSRARSWRSQRGRAGGASRGSKLQGWWAQMRQAAQYGEISVQERNKRGPDDLVQGDSSALLCSVKKMARPGGVLSGKKNARFRKNMTDRDPAEWASDFLQQHPSVYKDCLLQVQEEQADASSWGDEDEETYRRRRVA